MNEPSERPTQSEAAAPDAHLTEDARPSRQSKWLARARQYRPDLEERARIGFLLLSSRRYGEIEGKHLSLVIAMNLFVAIIPLSPRRPGRRRRRRCAAARPVQLDQRIFRRETDAREASRRPRYAVGGT